MPLRRCLLAVCLLIACLTELALPAPARANPENLRTNLVGDSLVIGGCLGAGVLLSLLEVDKTRRWPRELLPIDVGVRTAFSAGAARLSDITAGLSLAVPLVAQVQGRFDRAAGDRALVFAEALAVSYALNSAAKYLVQRPRPYVYSNDPRVQRWAEREGADSHVSFYSGHSAMTFASAMAGGMLLTTATDDTAARSALWGTGLSLAAFTATMRVRAGKHYYTDVLLGAVLGVGIGLGTPLLHDAKPQGGMKTAEYVSMGVGVAAGTLLGALLPVRRTITEELDEVRWAPTWTGTGPGLVVAF